MPAGYSGKPLHEKLGIKPGHRVCTVDAPVDYDTLLEGEVAGARFTTNTRLTADLVHIFATEAKVLKKELPRLVKIVFPDGAIWVSWPKKSAQIETDITEQTIRDIALPMGLVDIKVCAVSDMWSGLKLVVRRDRR
jgi:hypothetical protein